MKKLIIGLLILALVALPLLAACGKDEATEAPPTAEPTKAPAVEPTEEPAPEPTKEPAPEPTKEPPPEPTKEPPPEPTEPPAPVSIKIGNGGPPVASVDPCDFMAAPPPGVFEPLVGFDENEQMIPILAESWTFLEDGKVLEFKLKQDIVFSSGDPFTAADVEFSLSRHSGKNMAIMAQLSQNFDRLEVVDDYTIRFHFPAVNVQFLPQTCANMPITSKAYYDSVGEEGYLEAPVGTGPYRIVDWQEGQYVNVAYNELYRGAKPQITEASFLSAPDGATRVAMLQAGEVDMITQTPWTNVAALEDAGFARVDVPMPHDVVLQFDLLDPSVPWADVKVRQAINYAIDKEALIDSFFGGVPQEGVWQLPWELGYNPAFKPAYPYDLAMAQQLIEEAGYADGFDMPLYYPSFMEWGADMADYLTSAMQAININVELVGLSTFPEFMGTIEDLHKGVGDPAVILFDVGWPGNPEPVINLTNGFYMEKGNTLYDNPEVYDLINQALATLDDDARAGLVSQAYTIINDDLPFVPICLQVATTMMRSDIGYKKSVGGMAAGPGNLIDLTIGEVAAAPEPTAPEPTEAPAAAPVSIKIGNGGPPVASVDPCDFMAMPPPGIFEPLVGFDENEQMIPVLAESWTYLEDGKVLEFKLKQDIVFSNGDPFTAADVEFSMARHAEKNMPIMAQLSQNFDRLEVVDDYTIRFHFPAVNVQFLPQTCANMPITSKAYYESVGEEGYLEGPVGTGPYKIVDWQEGQYVNIAYNELYRGAKPQITEASFISAPDGATRVAMLQAGEVDMITQTPWTNVVALEDAGFARVDVPMPHDVVLQFDLLDPSVPWADVKVRQAINYAIDKEALIDSFFGGVPQEGVWQLPWELGYDPSFKPSYPYDLAMAQQLIEEAGYADGFDMPLYYPSFMEWGADLADYLTSALQAINVNVELVGLSTFPEFMGTIAGMHKGEVEPAVVLFDVGWPGNPEPVINLTNGFYMDKDNTLYDNPEVYDLINQALATLDDDARAGLVSQAYTIINDDLPFVPICLQVATTMMRSDMGYKKSVGGMAAGPANLIDLTVGQ